MAPNDGRRDLPELEGRVSVDADPVEFLRAALQVDPDSEPETRDDEKEEAPE